MSRNSKQVLLWYTRSSLQFLQEYIVLSLRLFLAHLLRLIRVISCFSVFFRNLSRHSWLPLLQSAPGSAVETRRDGLLRHLDGKYPLDVTNCLYHSYRKPHHHTKHVTSNLLKWSWITERSQVVFWADAFFNDVTWTLSPSWALNDTLYCQDWFYLTNSSCSFETNCDIKGNCGACRLLVISLKTESCSKWFLCVKPKKNSHFLSS